MLLSKSENFSRGVRGAVKLTSSKSALIAGAAVMLLILSATAASANQIEFFADFDTQGSEILGQVACALRGTFGWFMIAFGVLVGLWEYFIQRQGHLLVAALIGTVGIIILGRILPTNGQC